MIKAVLFDLDGTVINTNELVIASWKHALGKHLARCPEDREIIMSFGEPLVDTARRYDNDNADAICRTYREYNISVHDQMIRGYDGMEDTIKNLKSMGIKVGIVTSKMRETAERALRIFNLFDLMDVVVTVDDTEKHKPNPEPLLKAVKTLGLSPENVMYVGDTNYDMLCGKNAGCSTCAVRYSMVPSEELMKYDPDYMIDKPGDIIKIIREGAAREDVV